jgi:CBS domain-containing protein
MILDPGKRHPGQSGHNCRQAQLEETMNVARILKDKGREVAIVLLGTPLIEVVDLLAKKRIGATVVCDEIGHVKGIISERDVVRVLSAQGPKALDDVVEVHMTKDVKTCVESDSVEFLMESMTSQRFRHMPVVSDGRLVGIVSIGDVVKQRIAIAELEAASMRQYIATG